MVDSYVSPMRSMAPTGAPSQYTDPKSIDALLKSSDPEAVAASGRGYQRFAEAYEKIAGVLLNMRTDLHDAWEGKDAAAAQSQLREMWSAAATVREAAKTFGMTIERHGSEHLAWYKYNKPPSKSLSEAQSWMTGANERVAQAWGSLPQDLSTTLPPGDEKYHSDGWSPEHSAASRTSGRSSFSYPGDGDGSSASHGHRLDAAAEPNQIGDGGTQLAGLPPSVAPPAGAAPGQLGGFPLGGGVAAVGPGGVPASGYGPIAPSVITGVPGGMDGGAGRMTPGLSDEAAAAQETQAAEMSSASRAGMTGLPVGAERRDRERKRRSWLSEDEKVWTGDVQAAPKLIAVDTETDREWIDEPLRIHLSDADNKVIDDLFEELSGEDSPQDPQQEVAELLAKSAGLEEQAAATIDDLEPPGPIIGKIE
ncbi:hypothetical protein OG417_44135 [Actinoallomurus sp. NBC_01490]|uniref:hypothetical protein n=1 Tax=Actinoallomurus sp. NBC_01490 TaxID=2903557 RepID=UPI002E2EC7E3|nr:hypothetical protein [Actinoallomurus sp. NBC_01490]